MICYAAFIVDININISSALRSTNKTAIMKAIVTPCKYVHGRVCTITY